MVEVTCVNCGKKLNRPPCRINPNGNNYCIDCRRKSSKIKRICKQCGKEFEVFPFKVKDGHGIYCSRKCHHKSMVGKPATGKQLEALKKGQQKGKVTPKEVREKIRKSNKEFLKKHPESLKQRRGKNHYNWQGGISVSYSLDFTNDLKEKIYSRDNYTCQLCGITQDEHIFLHNSKLHTHHIDYNKKNSKKENLVSLCRKCHTRTMHKRICWEKYFKNRKKILEHLKMFESAKITYSYGVFDIIHRGHINLLTKAKNLGDYLIVGIVSDEAVKKKKGEDRPFMKQIERAYMISAIRGVDKVILQKDYDPTIELETLSKLGIRVNVLAKGDDWDYIPGQETIKKLGGELVKLPYSKGWSTSKMVKKIRGEV